MPKIGTFFRFMGGIRMNETVPVGSISKFTGTHIDSANRENYDMVRVCGTPHNGYVFMLLTMTGFEKLSDEENLIYKMGE
jgi:hypothetical protein